MTAHLRCDCGNQLRVFEHHVGRRVQCPACGKSHVVTADGITPALPAAGAAAGQGSRGRKRVLLVLLLLLLLAAGAMTPLLLFRKSTPQSEGDDLALIPANAEGFATLRVADLWKTPAMQKALKKGDDPAPWLVQQTGLRPEEVERLSGVTLDIDNRIGWIIVRTVAPYDVDALLSRLNNRREIFYQENRYHFGEGPDGNSRALYLAGPSVVVAGTETGVKRCLDFVKERPVKGPLESLVALAAEGKHTAVAAIFPPGGSVALSQKQHLGGIQRITVTLDVTDRSTLEATGRIASEDQATSYCKSLTAIQRAPKWIRKVTLATVLAGQAPSLVGPVDRLLDQVEFTQDRRDIRAAVSLDDGSNLAEGLLRLWKGLGQ
jgi:hypothetical protein